MKYWPCYLILILILQCCTSATSEKEQLKKLEEKVFKQHDETMRQMDKIMQLQGMLRTYVKQPPTPTTDTILIKKQLYDLEKADEAMMMWMHQYRSPDSLPPVVARSYLQEQYTKINQVEKQIKAALTAAVTTKNKYEINNKKKNN